MQDLKKDLGGSYSELMDLGMKGLFLKIEMTTYIISSNFWTEMLRVNNSVFSAKRIEFIILRENSQ